MGLGYVYAVSLTAIEHGSHQYLTCRNKIQVVSLVDLGSDGHAEDLAVMDHECCSYSSRRNNIQVDDFAYHDMNDELAVIQHNCYYCQLNENVTMLEDEAGSLKLGTVLELNLAS